MLIPITKSNWEDAAKLEVREEQKEYVAPNVWTIAESHYYPWVIPMAIMADDSMVGFLAYGRDPVNGQYWLYRFMIDQRFQNKGLGGIALASFLELLRGIPDCPSVRVGYQTDNAIAERLYLAAGFERGPLAEWGESTARYSFSR